MQSVETYMGGTQPWKAPETQRPIPARSLSSTDIYSLGLLIWLVSVDGNNPFDLLVGEQIQGASRPDEIEGFKQSDILLTIAHKKDWLRRYLVNNFGPQVEAMAQSVTQANLDTTVDTTLDSLTTQQQQLSDYSFSHLYNSICQEKLMRSLDDIFDHSLGTDPETRDLAVLVLLLESDETPRSDVSCPQYLLLRIDLIDVGPKLRPKWR